VGAGAAGSGAGNILGRYDSPGKLRPVESARRDH
jgi:hypothetical protein